MAYTPELSGKSSCTLRRIAWALGVPMTKAIEEVFDYLPTILDSKKVCDYCKDKTRCSGCVFKNSKGKELKSKSGKNRRNYV
jgi:hypothetical protein